MAGDLFFKFDGIKGESQDSKHANEIDVLDWSWGMQQKGTMHIGGGGGTAKVSVLDLSFTKYTDSATPNLMAACFHGNHIKSGLLTVRKAGGDAPVEYLKIKLEDIIVSDIKSGGDGSERTKETVSLNFARVHVDYTPQKPDGSPGATVNIAYDIAKNVKI